MKNWQCLTIRAANLLGPNLGYPINCRIHFQPFDGWIRIYPTLVCNLSCPYCVNHHNPDEYRGNEYQTLPPEKWVESLNRIGRNVVITGGEPFLYTGLDRLVNGLRPELKVKVYSNFSAGKTLEVARRFEHPVEFFISYHPASGPPDRVIENVLELRKAGRFNGHLHAIDTSDQRPRLAKALDQFRQAGVTVQLDPDQRLLFPGSLMKGRQTVRCERRVILIGPDGSRHQCVSKLVRRKEQVGHILDNELPEKIEVICGDYGFCAPCDFLGETRFRRVSLINS